MWLSWSASASAQTVNVTTYHYDNLRTGWNSNETVLTTSNVNSSAFGVVAQVQLDAQVDAQPLIVNGVVYVATENNTIYAIDAVAGTILQSVNLGNPAPSQNNACGGKGTNFGIKATPVIDAAAGVMYVITFTNENSTTVYRLHKLTIANLTEVTNIVVSASQLLSDGQSVFNFNPKYEKLTAGLLEANGNVYAAFGAWCDGHANVSRGVVLGWNAATLQPLPANQQPPNASNGLVNTQTALETPPSPSKYYNYFLSSIWMSGYGIASDASGDLFFSTGNSNGMVAHNLEESAVRLSADLTTVNDFFTPYNAATLDSKDNDLSGGGVMVVPDQPGIPPRVVAAGKGGTLYVMNRTLGMMGGYVPGGPDNPVEITIGKCHCGPSYFVGSDGVGRIVTSGGNGGTTGKSFLRTYKNTAVFPTTYEAQSTAVQTAVQDNSFFTSVSSNGTQAGSAIIWAVGRPTQSDPTHVTLYAFNAAASGGKFPPPLYSGVAGTWANLGTNANVVPVVANGRVYVASYETLTIFGLLPVSQLAPVKLASPLTTTANPPSTGSNTGPTEPQIFGTITSVSDDHIAVRLRSGKNVSVDLARALGRYESVIPFVGENVEVHGASMPDGSFIASSMWRTKEPAMWGPDRR
jgi:hypothetical protein